MRLPLISKATWVMTTLALVLSSGAAFAQTIGDYQVVSQAVVSPGVRDVTYRARLTNNGGPIQSATATLVGAPTFEIVDGTLNFGPVAAGGTGVSTDTFVVRQRSSSRPRFTWNVVVVPEGNEPGAVSLRIRPLANVRAGDPFTVIVEAVNASNNIDPTFTGNVNLNAAAVGGSNFVGGTRNAAAVAGVASFANVLLNNAADFYQVTASAAGITDGLSNTFNVTFTTLAVLPVANMQAGTLFNVVVEARDANGVAAENFGAASALTLLNLQAAVPATGQTVFNAAVAPTFGGGLGTFTGLGINNAANGYTFAAQATSTGVLVADAIDAAFNVTGTHLAVLAVGNVRSGTVFNVTAQARDANNNVAENFTGNVNLNAAAVGGSNFTGGTQNEASVGGVATFPNRLLNNAADFYQVTASAAGITDGLSNTFNVTFTTLAVLPVANMQAGTLFNVVVEARDANGVAAENFGAASALTLINLQAAVPATGQDGVQCRGRADVRRRAGHVHGAGDQQRGQRLHVRGAGDLDGRPRRRCDRRRLQRDRNPPRGAGRGQRAVGDGLQRDGAGARRQQQRGGELHGERQPERGGRGRLELHRRHAERGERRRRGDVPEPAAEQRGRLLPGDGECGRDHRRAQQHVQRDVHDAGGAAGGEHAGGDAVQRGGGGAGRERRGGGELRGGQRADAAQPAGGGAGHRADGVQRRGRADVRRRAGHVHGAGDQQRGQRLHVQRAGDLDGRPRPPMRSTPPST